MILFVMKIGYNHFLKQESRKEKAKGSFKSNVYICVRIHIHKHIPLNYTLIYLAVLV